MNGLIDYQCEVYESGYEIVTFGESMDEQFDSLDKQFGITSEDEDIDDGYIRPIDPKSTRRIFNLTDYPAAYYELANSINDFLSTNERTKLYDSIIKFTNKYGFLSIAPHSTDVMAWRYDTLSMKSAVLVWEGIKSGNSEFLKTIIAKRDGKFIVKIYDAIIKDNVVSSTYVQTPPRNYFEAAYHHISNVVNANLKDSLVTEIIVNQTNTGTDMSVRPTDLLSALWLQMAHAVSRNLEFKQCVACSTFFEVKSKKRKNEKIYCSDRCRVRVAARKRREKEKAK